MGTWLSNFPMVAQPEWFSQDWDLVQNLGKTLHKTCPRHPVSGKGRTNSRGLFPQSIFTEGEVSLCHRGGWLWGAVVLRSQAWKRRGEIFRILLQAWLGVSLLPNYMEAPGGPSCLCVGVLVSVWTLLSQCGCSCLCVDALASVWTLLSPCGPYCLRVDALLSVWTLLSQQLLFGASDISQEPPVSTTLSSRSIFAGKSEKELQTPPAQSSWGPCRL